MFSTVEQTPTLFFAPVCLLFRLIGLHRNTGARAKLLFPQPFSLSRYFFKFTARFATTVTATITKGITLASALRLVTVYYKLARNVESLASTAALYWLNTHARRTRTIMTCRHAFVPTLEFLATCLVTVWPWLLTRGPFPSKNVLDRRLSTAAQFAILRLARTLVVSKRPKVTLLSATVIATT
jgi:hypothetical protein